MSDRYPTKELLKLLPQQWPEGFVITEAIEEIKCSNCGNVHKPNQKFCPECGTPRIG